MRLRVFLVGGSPEARPPAGLAPAPGDRVIAADRGAAHARAWGWPLHLLIGDLDSLSVTEAAAVAAAGVPIITAPAAKDETDLELALAQALAEPADEIVICAALGGRVDHLLANVLLLARAELAGRHVMLSDGNESLRLLRGAGPHPGVEALAGDADAPPRPAEASTPDDCREGLDETAGHLELPGAAGDLLSLLPLGGDAVGVTTAGLQYPLRDETLFQGEARGVSNVFTGAHARITLRRGALLVIHTVTDR
jgi:thiamine pyrophosphokinase